MEGKYNICMDCGIQLMRNFTSIVNVFQTLEPTATIYANLGGQSAITSVSTI